MTVFKVVPIITELTTYLSLNEKYTARNLRRPAVQASLNYK